ncbi:MAG: hypothetical protein ACLVEJ_03735 [Parabacteroides sp.]
MENRLLLSVCIGGLLFAFSCNISTSRKLADTMPEDSICETSAHNMSDREVPAQEVPMRLLDKLSELYGDNPPGVIGFSVESKNCPDFIGGVYINIGIRWLSKSEVTLPLSVNNWKRYWGRRSSLSNQV